MEAYKTIKQRLDIIKETCDKEEITLESYFLIKHSFYELGIIFGLEDLQKENMETIWEIELQIATSKKKFKRKIEEDLLEFMEAVSINFDIEEEEEEETDQDDKLFAAASLLEDFVEKVFTIKNPRDAFSGKRKGYAIRILINISYYFDETEYLDFVKQALKDKSKTQFIAVTDAFQQYYKNEEILPDGEVIEIINKRYSKAKTKPEVMACLQFLVETTVISEYEALSMLDDWKENSEYW